MSMIPRKWHLYVVDLEPRVGTKPGKQRPCIAVQPTVYAEAGLGSTVLVPLTTQLIHEPNFPLRVRIPSGTCGLEKSSDALISQILAWDNALFRKELGILPEALQATIQKALREFLDIF